MPRQKAQSATTDTNTEDNKSKTEEPVSEAAEQVTTELPQSDVIGDKSEIVNAEIVEEGKALPLESTPEPLTPEEQKRREELEREVWVSFHRAGTALREIRDKRLYRSTHERFEDYCADTYSYTRRYPYYLIDAANSTDNIKTYLDDPSQKERLEELKRRERAVPIFPTNEFQIRPLGRLPTEKQGAAWVEALERAEGKNPSHELVRAIVEEILSTIEGKKRGKGGKSSDVATFNIGRICVMKPHGWGIVRASNKGRTELELWDGSTESAPTAKLRELSLDLKQRNRFKKLQKTLSSIAAAEELEEPAARLLDYFGQRTSCDELTALESTLLQVLEEEYIS